ncbi:hypothetical protein [Streptomyces mobaraensis]|nr:hypothetical protein [Streptomyces mobaraensis]
MATPFLGITLISQVQVDVSVTPVWQSAATAAAFSLVVRAFLSRRIS